MSKLSNLEANLELINLSKSISCLDEFTKQFNNLVSTGCLTNVFRATIYTIVNLNNNNNEKCMIICDKFNDCYVIYSESCSDVEDMIKHILNKNIKQDVLHTLLVRYMYLCQSVYPTEFMNVIDHVKLYLMFIEYSFYTISHEYEQIYLHFKNNKVDINKYNDIVVDNIIRKSFNYITVNIDIFDFTSEQLYKLNLYKCLNTRNTLYQTMIDSKFNYNVVKHILDTNPNYTPDSFIHNDVMVYCSSNKIRKIFKLLMSYGCFPQYINIVKYVIRYSIDMSLETLNIDDDDVHVGNRYLKLLIDNVVINPDDKMIYIPKYRNNIVLPVKRYFDDDSHVNINIFLASIVGHEDETMRVKDFRDIVKRKYKHHTHIYSHTVYMHVDSIYLMNGYTYIKTDSFIDYVLDKYSP